MDKKSWDKIILIAVSVLVVALSGLFVAKALGFGDRFGLESITPNNEQPSTDNQTAEIAKGLIDVKSEWKNPMRGEAAKPVTLFRSIPIVELDGKLIDMLDPNATKLRPPVENAWLMNNSLDYLNAGVLRQDPDGDGYSNLEEWEGKTEPKNPDSHPPYADKLRMVSLKQQTYKLRFAARPDAERFQITRMPTPRWPRRENFYLRAGEVSEDQQFRLDSFEEKSAERRGITVDASVLNITYLPKDTKYQLVRNVDEEIPTLFAEIEFLLEPGKTFIIKEGDTFPLARDPETKYRVTKVNENSAIITYQTGDQPEKTIEIKKN